MHASWHALLPPVVTLITAFFSRRIVPSIILGIVLAALIANDFSLAPSLSLIFTRMTDKLTDPDTIYTFLFLFTISSTIVLVSYTGAATAFAHLVTQKVRSARAVETATVALPFLLSIDDYLSALTVGYVMRPLTDRFSIPRVKLAFFIHSLAGPVVILNPISSWVAMIIGELDRAGVTDTVGETARINADPFFVFFYSAPFIFYSLLLIASIGFIVWRGISFGPMHTQEQIAQTDGNLFGGKAPLQEIVQHTEKEDGDVYDLIIPLALLVVGTITGISLGFEAPITLFTSSIIGFAAGCFNALRKNHIKLPQIPTVVLDGISLMFPAVATVTVASVLGMLMSTDLLAGHYFAHVLSGTFSLYLLPCIFFFVSALITFTTGSSWGTIALMIPIAIPMLIEFLHLQSPVMIANIPMLLPMLGAIFSGALAGDHLSPISETTVMTATSSGSYVLDHVKTQLPYAAPAFICSAFAYVLTGFFAAYPPHINFAFSFGISLLLCLGLLHMLDRKKG